MAEAVWEDEKSVIVVESDGDDDDIMITEVSGASLLTPPDDDVVFLKKSRRKRKEPGTSKSAFGSSPFTGSTSDPSSNSFDKDKSSLVSSQDGFSDKSDLSLDCQMWPKLDGFPFSSPIKSESSIDLGDSSLHSLLISGCGSGDHTGQDCKSDLTADLSLIGAVDSTAQARTVCRADEGGGNSNKSKPGSPFSLNPMLLKSENAFSMKDEQEVDNLLNHGQSSPLCLSRTPIKGSSSLSRTKVESNNNDSDAESLESGSQSVDSDDNDDSLLRFDLGPNALKSNNGNYLSNRKGSSSSDSNASNSDSDSLDSLPPSTRFGLDITSPKPGSRSSNLDQSQGVTKQKSDTGPVSKPITLTPLDGSSAAMRSEQSGCGSRPESLSPGLSKPSCKIDQSQDNASSTSVAAAPLQSASALPNSSCLLPNLSSDDSDSGDSLPEYTYKRVQKHFFKPINALSHGARKIKIHNPTPVKAQMLPDLDDPITNSKSSDMDVSPVKQVSDQLHILPEPHKSKKRVSSHHKHRTSRSNSRTTPESGSTPRNDCAQSSNSAFVEVEKTDCDTTANSSRDKLGQSTDTNLNILQHSVSSDESSDDDIFFLGTVKRSSASQPCKNSISVASHNNSADGKNIEPLDLSGDIPDRTSFNKTDHTYNTDLSRISATVQGTSQTGYSVDVTNPSTGSGDASGDLSRSSGLKMLIKPKQGIASFLVDSDSDSNSSTSSSSLSVTSSSCQPCTSKQTVAHSSSPTQQKPPCRFLEALLSNAISDNDISLNCRIPLKKRRRLASDEPALALGETTSESQNAPSCKCIVCTGIVSEFDVCECSSGHLCCRSCLEVEAKTLLTSNEKGTLKCPVVTCGTQFRLGELRKCLDSVVVEIIETRMEQEKAAEELQSMESNQAEAASSEVPKDLGLLPALPSNWEPMNSKEEYRLVWLESDGGEYASVADMFHVTMRPPRAHIKSIRRLQNPILWQFYAVKQAQMQKEAEGSVREQHLFHGTRKSVVDAICKNNFDWRLCGTNGTAYGQGAYFARDASYSHMYTDRPPMISGMTANNPVQRAVPTYISSVLFPSSYNALAGLLKDDPVVQVCHTHSMFLVRVLVGVYCQGYHNLRKPPPLFSHFPFGRCYDSCVNNVVDPNIYVIFDNSQCYPEYLIEYTNMPPSRLR